MAGYYHICPNISFSSLSSHAGILWGQKADDFGNFCGAIYFNTSDQLVLSGYNTTVYSTSSDNLFSVESPSGTALVLKADDGTTDSSRPEMTLYGDLSVTGIIYGLSVYDPWTLSASDTTGCFIVNSGGSVILAGGSNIDVCRNNGEVTISSTLTEASNFTLGLVKTGYTENGKNYPVELSSGQMYVNVPWTDAVNDPWTLSASDTVGCFSVGSGGSIVLAGGSNIDVCRTNGVVTIDNTLTEASNSILGLVKTGYTENGKNYPVELSSGQMYVNVPWTDAVNDPWTLSASDTVGCFSVGSGGSIVLAGGSNIDICRVNGVVTVDNTLAQATNSTLGLVKTGYTENGKNYPVELSSGQMYVNVPWIDNNDNTTYSISAAGNSGSACLVLNPSTGTDDCVVIEAGSCISVACTNADTITVNHSDTSGLSGVYSNTGNDFIQSITVDGFGHITGISSGTATSGASAGGDPHPTQDSIICDLSNGFVLQDITVNTLGHVTAVGCVNLDNRYFYTGNDGTGSNLDADCLDGQQGAYYLNYNNFTNTPTIPGCATETTLGTVSLASNNNAGAFETISTTSGRTYGIQFNDDTNQQLVVNVPWTDNNTTYTQGLTTETDGVKILLTPSTGSPTSYCIIGANDTTVSVAGCVITIDTDIDLSSYATTSHNHTLDSLSNTTITSNSDGEILRWNGSAWVNNTLSEAGIQPAGTYAAASHNHNDLYYTQTCIESITATATGYGLSANGRAFGVDTDVLDARYIDNTNNYLTGGSFNNDQLTLGVKDLSNVTVDLNGYNYNCLSNKPTIGSVTSVNLSAGSLIDIVDGPITSSGTIGVHVDLSELPDMTGDMTCTEDELVVLDNSIQKRKSINEIKLSCFCNDSLWTSCQGDITEVIAGTELSDGGSTGSVTINHSNVSRSDTTNVCTVCHLGSFTVVDSVSSNARGHITGINTKTVTISADSGGGGAPGIATSTTLGLVKLASDTEQTVSANTVTATANRTYGVQFNSNDQMVVNVPWSDTNTNTTYSLSADNNCIVLSPSSGLANCVVLQSGNCILVTGTNANTLTINHADTSSQTSVSCSSRTYISAVTLDSYGHVTGLDTATEPNEAQSGTQNYIPFWSNGTTLGDSCLCQSGTTVIAKNNLTVNGAGRFCGNLRLNTGWNNSTLSSNPIYAENSTDGFGFGVGTQISSWWVWSSTGGLNRMIDVENEGSYILFRTSDSDRACIDSSGLTVTGNISASGTVYDGTSNSSQWEQAYNNYITGIGVSGTTTKTITLTQRDGGTITTTFTDIDDNTVYNGWNLYTDTTDRGTIISDEQVRFCGGTDISLGYTATNNVITFNHDSITRTNTSNSCNANFGDSFSIIDSITSSAQGHITAVNTRTVTLPDETPHPSHTESTCVCGGISFLADITVNNCGHVTSLKFEDIRAGSTSQTGVVELATNTEVDTGTDFNRVITPSSLTSISKLGTIGTGVWEGTAIADAYIASASNWNSCATSGHVHSQYLLNNADDEFDGNLTVTGNVTAAQLYEGSNRVCTSSYPTVSDATICIAAGTALGGGGDFTLNQSGNETITINHDSVTRTNNSSSSSPSYGGTFTVIDSITSSAQGHITAVNTKTVTLPSADDTNTTYTLNAIDGSGDVTIRLTGTDSSTDDVILCGSSGVSINSSGDIVTIAGPDLSSYCQTHSHSEYDSCAEANHTHAIACVTGLQTALDSKQACLTFGISNTNAVCINSASVADNEYARFTASGLESRSVSEVRSDIGLGTIYNCASTDFDKYTGWVLYTDTTCRGTITSAEEVRFCGGNCVDLNYVATNNVITINHADTSTLNGASNNSGNVFIQDITVDSYGHVTAIGTGTSTHSDTTYGISSVDVAGTAEVKLRLTDSGSGTDDVTICATQNISIQSAGDIISITGPNLSSYCQSHTHSQYLLNNADDEFAGNLTVTDNVTAAQLYEGSNRVCTAPYPTNTNQLTNGCGFTDCTGTVQSVAVTVGTGLDVTGSPITTSGTINLSLDLSEFSNMTGALDGATDSMIILDSGSEKKSLLSTVNLGEFCNNLGWNNYSHPTQSSISVDNSNGNVLQDISVNSLGHVTSVASINLDDRYYTESEVDTKITTAVNDLVNAAPAALDTLDELANALGDDANFAATMTASLASKQCTLTFGIADTNTVCINSADVANNEYAKFTSSGLSGRSIEEVRTDIGVGDGALTQNNFTTTLKTKLDGIAASANNYSLPVAESTALGGIELFSDTVQSVAANDVTAVDGRTYGIQLNSANQAVVNVPWSNTNTTITPDVVDTTNGAGIKISGMVGVGSECTIDIVGVDDMDVNVSATAGTLEISSTKATNAEVIAATINTKPITPSNLTSITKLGAIGVGTWQGTAIADDYISSAVDWNSCATSGHSHSQYLVNNADDEFDGNLTVTGNVTAAQLYEGSNRVCTSAYPTVPGAATATALGLVKLISNTQQACEANSISGVASRTYGLQLNSSNQLVVNVPWSDNNDNTTYSIAAVNVTGSTSAKLRLSSASPSGTDDVTFVVGQNLTIQSGDANTITITGPDLSSYCTSNTTYSEATNTTLGLVKIGYTESGKNYPVELSSGQMYVNVPWTDNNTTYSAATTSTLGLVKLESGSVQSCAANAITETSGRTYGVQFNSSNQLVVNVPWSDTNTNTTYSAGNGIGLTGTSFSVAAGTGLTQTETGLKISDDCNTAWHNCASTNNYVDSISFNSNDGNITIGRSGLGDLTVCLDGRYCTSDTNTTYSAGNGIGLTGTSFSVAAGTGLEQTTAGLCIPATCRTAIANGDTAHGWGNHASANYLTVHPDTNPQISQNTQFCSAGEAICYITTDSNGHVIALDYTDNLCTSDYRAKTCTVSYNSGYESVKNVDVYKYVFKEDENQDEHIGMMAHELQESGVEYGVSGYKDEVDEDGDPVLQTVDLRKLVPTLWSALKTAIGKIEDLESRIDKIGLQSNI